MKEALIPTLTADLAMIDGMFMIQIILPGVVWSEDPAGIDGSKMSVVKVVSESVSGPACVRMRPD